MIESLQNVCIGRSHRVEFFNDFQIWKDYVGYPMHATFVTEEHQHFNFLKRRLQAGPFFRPPGCNVFVAEKDACLLFFVAWLSRGQSLSQNGTTVASHAQWFNRAIKRDWFAKRHELSLRRRAAALKTQSPTPQSFKYLPLGSYLRAASNDKSVSALLDSKPNLRNKTLCTHAG